MLLLLFSKLVLLLMAFRFEFELVVAAAGAVAGLNENWAVKLVRSTAGRERVGGLAFGGRLARSFSMSSMRA